MLCFITGGARSGKSRYAQQFALELSDNPVYVATARHWDDDFEQRIQRHRRDRDQRWETLEIEKYLSRSDFSGRVVVIDCLTLWLTNFFADRGQDVDACLRECQAELTQLFTQPAHFIIVSNELGMGLHAETPVGRRFVDLQGWMNQFVATRADRVYLMVSGLPLRVKPATGQESSL